MTSREKLICVIAGIVLGCIAGSGTYLCNEKPSPLNKQGLCYYLGTDHEHH